MEWAWGKGKRWRVGGKNKIWKMCEFFFKIGIKKFIINMKNTAVTGIGSDSAFYPGSLLTLAA